MLDTKQVSWFNKIFIEKISHLDLAIFEDSKNVTLAERAFNRCQFQLRYCLKTIIDIWASFLGLAINVFIFFLASPIIAVIIVLFNAISIYVRSKYATGKFLIWRADAETKMKFEYLYRNLFNR